MQDFGSGDPGSNPGGGIHISIFICFFEFIQGDYRNIVDPHNSEYMVVTAACRNMLSSIILFYLSVDETTFF